MKKFAKITLGALVVVGATLAAAAAADARVLVFDTDLCIQHNFATGKMLLALEKFEAAGAKITLK